MPTVFAMMDSFSVIHDRVLNGSSVLSNDMGSNLTASVVTNPTHGSLTLNSNGTFQYTPVTHYTGADSFVYKATSGSQWSNATVSINVTNMTPFLTGQTLTVVHDWDLDNINIGGYATDSDNPGETLAGIIVTGPSHGTLTQNGNGTYKYTPTANYTGSDSFTAKVSDGVASSSTVTFSISVTNQTPSGQTEEYSVPHDQTLDVQTTDGVLENDTDADGDWLTTVLMSSPAHGTLTLDSDGAFRYTPTANYVGNDSFTYRNTDGVVQSSTVTVTLHVTNIAPVAAADRYRVDPAQNLEIESDLGILTNDKDGDDILSPVITVAPVYGTLTMNSDGSFSYVPDQYYPGEDSFTYNAVDGMGLTSQAVVYLSTDDTSRNDEFHIGHNGVLTLDAESGVLSNDDADAAATVYLITAPLHGDLTLNSDGSLEYTPDLGYIGPDQFTYRITNSDYLYGQSIAKIDVFNVAPVAQGESFTTSVNTALTVNAANGVLSNDYDDEIDPLTATIIQQPSHGTLQFNANGSFTFTPTTGFVGNDGFSYKVSDGTAFCNYTIFVPLLIGQAPAYPTLSGIVTYDVAPAAKAVRRAHMELHGRNFGGWRKLSEDYTNILGEYSLWITDATLRAYRVVVYAQTPTIGNATNHILSVMSGSYSTFNLSRNAGRLRANTVQNINIGSTARNEKAFWTFDAAVTANKAHGTIEDTRNRPTSLNIQYPWVFTSMAPYEGRMDLGIGDFKDWDTINHEYGHLIQYEYRFFDSQAIFAHDLGENARVAHYLSPAVEVNKLAFKEGFANFYSMYAQEIDTSAPSLFEFDLTRDWFTRDMKLYTSSVEDEFGGMSAGEDEELTVMRTLWDLYDAEIDIGPNGEPLDNIDLGFQNVYDLIANRNPPPGGGTVEALTLNRLWNNILAGTPATNAANRLELIEYGAVFELNNVAPYTGDSAAGMYIAGIQAASWSATTNANQIPEFWFKVPSGMLGQASTAQLLNSFRINFFSADYSQMVTYTGGFTINTSTNWGKWTPIQARWVTISSGLGTGTPPNPFTTKHWVVEGGWASLFYTTGLYWGSANDFSITA